MSTIQVATWRPAPGRAQELIQRMAEAKKIHERLGAVVTASQANLAGPASGIIGYVMGFESRSAWGKCVDALATDAAWQKFVVEVLQSADPPAALLSNSTLSDVPGFEQPIVRPAAGEVGVRQQWRITPGRFADVIRDLAEWQRIAKGQGVTGVRFLTAQDAGPDTGLLSTAFRCANFAAYGALTDKLGANAEFQAFYAHVLDAGAATPLGTTVSQYLPI